MDKALRKNIRTLYCMSFCQSAMIVTAVFVPLLQRHGLSLSQVLQTQALFALVIAVCEVPSGYLADTWGRRNTIVVGQALWALAFLQLISADSLADFLLYETLMGLGMSLFSGADLALLYDSQSALSELTEEPGAVSPGRHIARLVSLESYGAAASGILASLLTLWSLDWVLWGQAAIGLCAFGFAMRLSEAPRQISVAGHRENARKVVHAIASRPVVLWTALALILFGLAALYSFWLLQSYWELQGVPLALFGYLWAGHCLLRGLSAHYAPLLEQCLGWRNALLCAALLPLFGFLGMGLWGGLAGILFGLTFPLGRGMAMVIFYDALNSRLSADFRATVNSLVSLGMRGLFIVSGPLLGWLADSRGLHATLLILAAGFVPAALLVLLPLARRISREQHGAAAAEDKEAPLIAG